MAGVRSLVPATLGPVLKGGYMVLAMLKGVYGVSSFQANLW
jgi:glycosyltransferase A (GT-A) superfamily protein (DUF2064 family)